MRILLLCLIILYILFIISLYIYVNYENKFNNIKLLLLHEDFCDKNNIETFDVHLGHRIYKCSLNYLNIKKEQHCTFKKQGISQIIENDMYNINYKSDVIINIVIEV